MGDKKLKILMLGSNDNRFKGHVFSTYESLPDCFEKKLVVFETFYNDRENSFVFYKGSFLGKIRRRIYYKYLQYRRMLKTLSYISIDNNKKEYCFFGNEYVPRNAKKILKKCNGFTPDIISIHWTSNFISSETIKELHNLTGATIVFVFVDEAHMTGGCHYPVECQGYLSECTNCPALKKGKHVASLQLKEKLKNLSNIPKIIIAAPYDCRLALKSKLFKNIKVFPDVCLPQMQNIPTSVARNMFGIANDEFVIMIGANHLGDKRKGLLYSTEAIKDFANFRKKICVLAPGKSDSPLMDMGNARIIYPGFLDFNTLCTAFCAADCFLSTTIADSGPMMVNFSIILGTPVVSFNIGIAQDLVIHEKTGYIANYMDSKDVNRGIEYIYSKGKAFFSTECEKLIDQMRLIPNAWQSLYEYFCKNNS